jgi:hypothetical protein
VRRLDHRHVVGAVADRKSPHPVEARLDEVHHFPAGSETKEGIHQQLAQDRPVTNNIYTYLFWSGETRQPTTALQRCDMSSSRSLSPSSSVSAIAMISEGPSMISARGFRASALSPSASSSVS